MVQEPEPRMRPGLQTILRGRGRGADIAPMLADHLIAAESAGVASHGVFWVLEYARQNRRPATPDDKTQAPGGVVTTTRFVDHPVLVARRIGRFTDIAGSDRVVAGSDGGFGTFAGFAAVDPDIACASLASLAEGAALAGLAA